MIVDRQYQRLGNRVRHNAASIIRNTITRLGHSVLKDNPSDPVKILKTANAILGARCPNIRTNDPIRPLINMPPGSKVSAIEQEVIIVGATSHDVFEVLMDEQRHAALTKGEAQISRQVGGAFTTFDGWASGKQLELVPDKKIKQTWRAEDWPAGEVSVCTYLFSAVAGGTKIQFTQAEVPKSFLKNVAQGWHDYYWQPLQALFKPV